MVLSGNLDADADDLVVQSQGQIYWRNSEDRKFTLFATTLDHCSIF